MEITREELGNEEVYDKILEVVKKRTKGFGKFFKKTFSREEAAQITELALGLMEIKNLDFLRYLPNLEEIDFHDVTGLSHITGLCRAPRLRWVTFWNTDIPNLEEIAECRNLDFFAYECDEGYEHCAKSDFSFLKLLPNLTGINLEGNPLTDVECLVSCSQLKEIALVRCPVRTIAPLQELQHLTHLDLSHCGLRELENLEKFPSLEVVSVEEDAITEEQIAHYRSICEGVDIFTI